MNALIQALKNLVVSLKKYMQNPTIIDWANAIAKAEGANKTNNPGNLKYSTLIASWGGERGFQAKDGGWIAKFPDYQTGFKALCNFLQLGKEDFLVAFHEARTLELFTEVYAGKPPLGYYSIIYTALGVDGAFNVSDFIS